MQKNEILKHRFLVLGAARSGIAAAMLLKRQGADVAVADEKAVCTATAVLDELDAAGIRNYWGERVPDSLAGRTVLIKSPGIPQTNSIVTTARKSGMRIVSEIELAWAFASPAAKVIAITGTNGKTTTTAWAAHIIAAGGFNAVLGGNIGDAWSNSVDAEQNQTDKTIFVVECSSFQLEDMEDFRPDIAIVTNLSPDHMDRYDDSFESYVAAKQNIMRNMRASDTLVLNGHDKGSFGFNKSCKCGVNYFSRGANHHGAPGAYLISGDICFRDEKGESSPVLAACELPLPGDHNLENALAAARGAKLVGVADADIRTGLLTFRGVEHRIELCGERADGVRFYNDSKATNLDAMEKALRAFGRPIIVIAGGRDAHSDYASINDLVASSVKQLILIGEAADLIESVWGDLVPTLRADDMEDAVHKAADLAEANDIVVLSPACKSFDMYDNFEQRGRDFKEQVTKVL